MNDPIPSYRPSVFYFRKSLRAAKTKQQAVQIGLVVCSELEELKAWVRAQGLIPPKWKVDPDEVREKKWPTER